MRYPGVAATCGDIFEMEAAVKIRNSYKSARMRRAKTERKAGGAKRRKL